MSEKHLPKHVRGKAKEMKAALEVIKYLQSQNALYPSANIHMGDIAGAIGVGMGTVDAKEVEQHRAEREARPQQRESIDEWLTY